MFLLPFYLIKILVGTLPTLLQNAAYLLSPGGWDKLVTDTENYRADTQLVAMQQLHGSYSFKEADVHRLTRGGNGWMSDMVWSDETEGFTVCGATARYAHLRPANCDLSNGDQSASRRPIVFLHGNPSWGFMWRNVSFPRLQCTTRLTWLIFSL